MSYKQHWGPHGGCWPFCIGVSTMLRRRKTAPNNWGSWLLRIGFVCLFGFLTSSSTTRLYRGRAPRQERLTILRAATHETELGDHDFCLSRSHYTDTDPTCRERAATAGIEPGTSSPKVACSTAELPRPPLRIGVSTTPRRRKTAPNNRGCRLE